MERKENTTRFAILKWLALFALVFTVSVPLNTHIAKAGTIYRVNVEKGYLALRSDKAYDKNNEIGKLYSGDTVEVTDTSDATYWYVYVASLNKAGYVNKDYLKAVDTSNAGNWTVRVSKGYLALRSAKAYDSSNEIGKLYTGDTVQVTDSSDATYWYVYAPTLNQSGYVNKDYLYNNSSSGETRTVKVAKGYLALRTAKAYDSSNEIGELYTGDVVQLRDTSDATYWYVYSPKLNKEGYVNKNYLTGGSSSAAPSTGGDTWTVKVAKGYLALRTAKAFDSSNEIGELYTGDTVQVTDSSDGTYWYVYSPKLNKSGYVNKNYLVGGSTASTAVTYPTKTVSVAKGYLALRTAKAFDDSNEIGQLYSGDTVEVRDTSDSTYWYVYSPKLGKEGYVNCNYLY